MRKSLVFVFLILGGIISVAYTENITPNGRFLSANQFFESGDLTKAESLYLELVGQGFESSALYYNLGNLYYRKGERGKSVLWYERASRLSPRDSDISFNLALARSHIKDEKTDPIEKIFLLFTNKEMGWVMCFFILIFFGLLGSRFMGWIKIEWSWPPFVIWISGIFLILTSAWFGINTYYTLKPIGILISPMGEIRNGPGNDYAVGCTLPEGSRLLVLDKRPDWIQVGVLQQELKGWIPSKDVEIISDSWSI